MAITPAKPPRLAIMPVSAVLLSLLILGRLHLIQLGNLNWRSLEGDRATGHADVPDPVFRLAAGAFSPGATP